MLRHRRFLPVLVACLAGVSALWSAPLAPPDPETWQATIRYQIQAFRTERIRQYTELTDFLKGIGFVRDPDDIVETEAEDPDHTLFKGTLPASAIPRLLPERRVRTVLLVPDMIKLPEKDVRVRVDLHLSPGLLPDRQRALARQTAEVLTSVGFQEAAGYDHRAFTRLLGSIPSSRLLGLLDDLRRLPAGAKQGAPFQSVRALKLVVARPDLPVPAPRPAPPAVPPGQEKMSADLRALLLDPAGADQPGRLEVILGYTPEPEDRQWIVPLTRTGAIVEGRIGPLVTVRATPKAHATALAALSEVVAVRLPRVADPSRGPGRENKPEKWQPLLASGLVRLHAFNKRGQGTRLAVVAGDFQGWETLKGRREGKEVFPDPVLVDLTRERNPDLSADPFPAGEKDRPFGPGTLCARALLRSAPAAELTLIRIDPAAAYQLEAVARAINGEPYRTVAIDDRLRELNAEQAILDAQGKELVEERRAALDDFRDDEVPRKRREAYLKKQAEFDQREKEHRARLNRYVQFVSAMRSLKGIRVVANSLVWPEGFPVDGSSALSRFFDDCPFKAALWFQAAGDTAGQAWTGPFRDHDGNGILEFAPPTARLAPERWTPELNFLAWQPADGGMSRELPGGVRLRISFQWKEAHDPTPLRVGEDPYRQPLSSFRIVVFEQADPTGRKQPADDLEVVAQSAGLPQRLGQTLAAAHWEQTVEVRLPHAGTYAVRIEGRAATGVFAPGENHLPITQKFQEIRPRLFVRTLEGPGRAVWADYVTEMASLGVPADARSVITVGAADPAGRATLSSAPGSPWDLALLQKPDVLAYDEGLGTGPAAAFAAGLIASAHTAGVPLVTSLETLCVKLGQVLRVPEKWSVR
jgi:hypothetical protein